ncbi:MAG: hypothetical protein KC944_16760 [Candidatus Omnitrophica bacterium]|nr:hypothetical protein [Candidatus Omnitrophota bacterium]
MKSQSFGLIIAAILVGALSVPSVPAEPIHLHMGRHLFVDDFLIDRSEHFEKTLHHPEKIGRAIRGGMETPDRNNQPYATILRDEETGKFRMWYNTRDSAEDEVFLSYTESEDGIVWDQPFEKLLFLRGFGCCVIDRGDEENDPAKRFRLIYWGTSGEAVKYYKDPGASIRVAFSPDGIEWTPYENNPVLRGLWEHSILGDPQGVGSIEWRRAAQDIIQAVWDPTRQRYLALVKTWTWPPDELGEISPTSSGMGRRLSSWLASPDFIHWSTPERAFVPDDQDPALLEFYSCRPKVRGNQLINLSCILNEGVGSGIGYTVVATSNDGGETWDRMREPWLDRTAWHPEAIDHAVAWVSDLVTVGDRDYIYYGCYNVGHKTFSDRTLSMAFQRKDGFISRDALGPEPGTLITPEVTFDSNDLFVNAKVYGQLNLRFVDSDGAPLPGFDWNDIPPIQGDSVEHLVKLPAPLPGGQAFHIEFRLKYGELYGFELR